eukprot:gene8650-biopygen6145
MRAPPPPQRRPEEESGGRLRDTPRLRRSQKKKKTAVRAARARACRRSAPLTARGDLSGRGYSRGAGARPRARVCVKRWGARLRAARPCCPDTAQRKDTNGELPAPIPTPISAERAETSLAYAGMLVPGAPAILPQLVCGRLHRTKRQQINSPAYHHDMTARPTVPSAALRQPRRSISATAAPSVMGCAWCRACSGGRNGAAPRPVRGAQASSPPLHAHTGARSRPCTSAVAAAGQ